MFHVTNYSTYPATVAFLLELEGLGVRVYRYKPISFDHVEFVSDEEDPMLRHKQKEDIRFAILDKVLIWMCLRMFCCFV